MLKSYNYQITTSNINLNCVHSSNTHDYYFLNNFYNRNKINLLHRLNQSLQVQTCY